MKRGAIELSIQTIIIVGLAVILFVFLILFLTTYFPQATGFLTDLQTSTLPNMTEIAGEI